MQKPCPLCRTQTEIKMNKKSRPFLRCDNCGVLMFINKEKGIQLIKKGAVHRISTRKKDSLADFIER
jgi:uncharacterized Zn finger protein